MRVDLDRLFGRLRRYEERAYRNAMDPLLPGRVQLEIEAAPRRRRTHAAAALLLLLLVGHVAQHLRGRVPAAQAGPLEARRLYDAAKAKKNAPWPEAVPAFRAVLREAGRADPVRARALRAIASIFEKAGLPHAATAARHSASRASRHADSLASYQLACARSLLAEGDLDAARMHLERIVALGAHRASSEVAAALRLLAQAAYDARDRVALRSLVKQMDAEDAPLPLQIAVRGDLGLLHLRAGAPLLARRCLKEARRLFAKSQDDAEDETARKAVKVWLDLPLRKALPP